MRKEIAFEQSINPPASFQEIQTAEAELAVVFPSEIVSIYKEYNGIPEYRSERLPFHLLPLGELTALNKAFLDETSHSALFRKYGLVCFWGDDQSNYAGLYVGGPLDGRVCFVDHEGYYVGDVSPLFRDVNSFTNRVIELAERNHLISQYFGGLLQRAELKKAIGKFSYQYYEEDSEAGWHAMPVDYPSSNSSVDDQDSKAYEEIRTALNKGAFDVPGEREFLVYALARLTPLANAESLLPFLAEDDMYIPGQVCNMLWLRRHSKALPDIAALAVRGNHNSQSSAEWVLAKFIVSGVSGAWKIIDEQYKKLNGDTNRLEAIVQRIRESPTLMYQ